MHVYAPNFDKFFQKLSELTGMPFSSEMNGQYPAATLIVRYNKKIGGVEDPAPHITDPARTLVVAGLDNDRGLAFAEDAINAGVSELNVIITPKGQALSLQVIAERLQQMAAGVGEQEQEAGGSEEYTQPVPVPDRVKVIAVTGYRGGTGRTTAAMSLARHYSDINERVAVLDLGSPPGAHLHIGVEMQEAGVLRYAESFCDIFAPATPVWQFPAETVKELTDQLRAKYRRVIVDFSAEPVPGHLDAVNPDRVVAVMDSDVEQSVEPAQELKGMAVFLYNKAVPEVTEEIITDIVGVPPVVIVNDLDGCQSALSTRETAYRTSEAVTAGIGKLAAALEELQRS